MSLDLQLVEHQCAKNEHLGLQKLIKIIGVFAKCSLVIFFNSVTSLLAFSSIRFQFFFVEVFFC